MLNNNGQKNKYADIIDLPHHVSVKRPHMPTRDRAAQFAPFAALTGHDAAVKETARLTEEMIQLDENEIAVINDQLQQLRSTRCRVAITYFVPDDRKDGGSYVTEEGNTEKIDDFNGSVIMDTGNEIPVKNIIKIKF